MYTRHIRLEGDRIVRQVSGKFPVHIRVQHNSPLCTPLIRRNPHSLDMLALKEAIIRNSRFDIDFSTAAISFKIFFEAQ